jgi:hypothetical protein
MIDFSDRKILPSQDALKTGKIENHLSEHGFPTEKRASTTLTQV